MARRGRIFEKQRSRWRHSASASVAHCCAVRSKKQRKRASALAARSFATPRSGCAFKRARAYTSSTHRRGWHRRCGRSRGAPTAFVSARKGVRAGREGPSARARTQHGPARSCCTVKASQRSGRATHNAPHDRGISHTRAGSPRVPAHAPAQQRSLLAPSTARAPSAARCPLCPLTGAPDRARAGNCPDLQPRPSPAARARSERAGHPAPRRQRP